MCVRLTKQAPCTEGRSIVNACLGQFLRYSDSVQKGYERMASSNLRQKSYPQLSFNRGEWTQVLFSAVIGTARHPRLVTYLLCGLLGLVSLSTYAKTDHHEHSASAREMSITGTATTQSVDPNSEGPRHASQNATSGKFTEVNSSASKAAPPNIVVVLLDDAGFSDYSFLGSRIRTPTIDALAENGLTVTHFYVQPRCSPTRAALLTGRDPHSVGLGFLTAPAHVEPTSGPYQGYLDPESVTIAEALRGAGYRSYLAGKWHLGERPENWPLAHGFDEYFGLISGASSYFELITDQPMVRTMARGEARWTPPGDNFYMTDATTDFAVERLEAHSRDRADKPFFLMVSYTAPHWPLHAPREAIADYENSFSDGTTSVSTQRLKTLKAQGLTNSRRPQGELKIAPPELMEVYAAQMTKADSGIARIQETLGKLGYLENTLILIFSDNGASAEDVSNRGLHKASTLPGDRGSYLSYGPEWATVSNTPFRGHKGSTFEGGIRSPIIVHWPRGLTAKNTIDTETIVDVKDLYPTILDLAGAHVDHTLPGENFAHLLTGGAFQRTTPLFWEHTGWRGVRAGPWKAVFNPRQRKWALYDIAEDAGERIDLALEHPDVITELSQQWQAWSDHVGTEGFDREVWRSYFQSR